MNALEFFALSFLIVFAWIAVREISKLEKERDQAIAIASEFVAKAGAARKAFEGVSSCSTCGMCQNVAKAAMAELDE